MGARTHVSPARTEGARPRFELLAETLRFFDQHVAGVETGLLRERRVHYYTMVEEAWHAADRFPPAGTAMRRWGLGDGVLMEGDGAGVDVYRADQSLGTGANTRYERIAGQAVETYYGDWDGRDRGMLCWTGAAMEEELEITGSAVVELLLEVDTFDAAVIVYLEDVSPEGGARDVTEGALRASCRAMETGADGLPSHPCTRAGVDAYGAGGGCVDDDRAASDVVAVAAGASVAGGVGGGGPGSFGAGTVWAGSGVSGASGGFGDFGSGGAAVRGSGLVKGGRLRPG